MQVHVAHSPYVVPASRARVVCAFTASKHALITLNETHQQDRHRDQRWRSARPRSRPGGGARRCAPRPSRRSPASWPADRYAPSRARVDDGGHLARERAASCPRADPRAPPRTRARAAIDRAAAVEPVEVGVAGAVDPDPLGGQRWRLGPDVLERVDGGGDLAHDPRPRSPPPAARRRSAGPAAAPAAPARPRPRGPRASARHRRRAGAGARPRPAGARAPGSGSSPATRAARRRCGA